MYIKEGIGKDSIFCELVEHKDGHTFCSISLLRLSLHVKRQTDQLRSDPQLVACIFSSRNATIDRLGYIVVMQLVQTARLVSTGVKMGCPCLFLLLACKRGDDVSFCKFIQFVQNFLNLILMNCSNKPEVLHKLQAGLFLLTPALGLHEARNISCCTLTICMHIM